MDLKTKIYSDYIQSMKDRDILKKNLLSVVKGEIQNLEKTITTDVSDSDVIKIATKISKSLKETLSSSEIGSDMYNDSKREMDIIGDYLPKEMSKVEIESKINDLLSKGCNSIALIMKEFSSDQVDRKIVMEMSKELLK